MMLISGLRGSNVMSELKKRLMFWRVLSCVTALSGVLYVVKYDFDIVFIMIFIVFAMMFHTTQAIKQLLIGQ